MNVLKIVPINKVTFKQKQAYVKEVLTRRYEKEEKESNAVNIPYFMRAESETNRLTATGKIETTYNRFKKEETK